MLALVVVLIAMVLLLGVLVVGLLRSHADIIRALHTMGVGVGDPAAPESPRGVETPVALRLGPPLPGERSSSSVHDLTGVSPTGDAVVVSTSTSGQTLLAFLSSGCTSCAAFWSALGDPAQRAMFPAALRMVVVTKGPEFESPDVILAKAPAGTTVIMSTAAWSDYEVPGSPFFVLIDGATGTRAGEGVANHLAQVADLVGRADLDAHGPAAQASPRPAPAPGAGAGGVGPAGVGTGGIGRNAAVGLNGADRERANDEDLRAAGILPGHPSLYPRDLDDVFAATAGLARSPQPGAATAAMERD